MEALLLYIIKSGICLTIFYLCVKTFLSNETFFRFNRIVLLAGMAVCLLLPFIKINVNELTIVQKPFIAIEEAFKLENKNGEIEENIEIAENSNISESSPEKASINVGKLLLAIYMLGGVVNITLVSRSFFNMHSLIRSGKKKTLDKYILVVIPKDITPFSWGKYIVLSEKDYDNHPDEIITHEIAHAKHRHSIDLFFMELIVAFQWFNPAVWLLKRELKDVHEYQADMSVLKSGIDATKYQLLLVKKAVGTSSYTLANSFNHSKIKKRITMMLKEKSNKWARLRLLLTLPLAILSVYAFARHEVNEPLHSLVNYESMNNFQKKKQVPPPPPPLPAEKQKGDKKAPPPPPFPAEKDKKASSLTGKYTTVAISEIISEEADGTKSVTVTITQPNGIVKSYPIQINSTGNKKFKELKDPVVRIIPKRGEHGVSGTVEKIPDEGKRVYAIHNPPGKYDIVVDFQGVNEEGTVGPVLLILPPN